ncbi:wall-associated receptor kinase-like 1 [Durio zibethinus]|uniref:Wall-associated receptor kinase-like 1 n=1 Tax=Durio zibethinus TaxID=66656 RepID=A0A6P5Y153_DURZI|nr:wall-associated receptor kinase-like 1 [Durio zibethinus]
MAFHFVVKLVILLLLQPWLITEAITLPKSPKMAKPNCTDRCGNVNIPYPFGVEDGCFFNESFRVTCNKTIDGGRKPFISSINLELLNVSFSFGTARVLNPVTKFNCSKTDNSIPFPIYLESGNSPFFFSNGYNRFAFLGCRKWSTIVHNQNTIGGCLLAECSDKAHVDGCHIRIPPTITYFVANQTNPCGKDIDDNIDGCGSAFMIADDMLKRDDSIPDEIINQTHVPAVLQWSIPINGMCNWKKGSNSFCDGDGDHCWRNLSSTHFCVCSKSKKDGTQLSEFRGFGKFADWKHNFCQMLCLTNPGKFHCTWPCPDGYESYTNAKDHCYPKDLGELLSKKSRTKTIIIGCSTGSGTIVLLIGAFWCWKVANRRKNVKLKQNNFKRNGGLLLQQKLCSHEGTVEMIRLFTSEELENATDNYSAHRILGQGGQGTVYKGMLADGSIVAIKKPKRVGIGKKFDEKKLQEFINEMIILSQINHRNVVKLLGCCLETQVPLLVYEFIINGTLSQHIHEKNEELFPIRWEMRLRIAVDVANALSYMHSSASAPIYHRDIKSSNILLDDKYRAKVSDFGTSRSITSEQTHLTTQVQGTFGYLDPEYFRSNQFTEKSDVYSFGVVLTELLTGQKPLISSSQTEEVRSLAACFLLSMEENSLFDILDQSVMKDGSQKEITAVAKLAKRCLNLDGKERPTMKEVAMELELIRVSKEAHAIQKDEDKASSSTNYKQ